LVEGMLRSFGWSGYLLMMEWMRNGMEKAGDEICVGEAAIGGAHDDIDPY